MNKIVESNQLNTYIHRGFWQKQHIEKLWAFGNAPLEVAVRGVIEL